jgi:hypothetical protein
MKIKQLFETTDEDGVKNLLGMKVGDIMSGIGSSMSRPKRRIYSKKIKQLD